MDVKFQRKLARKQKRKEEILLKHDNVSTSLNPTRNLVVGNGGLICGIQREFLIELFAKYGEVKNIIMLPDKPYAFVIYNKVNDAMTAKDSINGKKLDSGHIFYLSYVNDHDVPKSHLTKKEWPKGLYLLEDFITESEENELLALFNFDDSNVKLKHRKVKHFGYEFIYGSNNIDKNKPLENKIPNECLPHLQKLIFLNYIKRIPDQLTVNHYAPGQGIPPHIDTHSAFEEKILSLSLGSQVIMDFYSSDKECFSILLPRRSLLIMSGESRYIWKHGITPRKTDVITLNADDECQLTLSHRSSRTSLTYRFIRLGECNCEYKDYCDSQKNSNIANDLVDANDLVNEEEAKEFEKKCVHQVYEEIANNFSNTRYKPWPKVEEFLKSISPGSILLDIGCGNGKNMSLTNHCFEIGCDVSSKLLRVCTERNFQVLMADCLNLPFKDKFADAIICIAVIHHMSTKTRRAKAIEEIIRVLDHRGKALIYVWAFEQETSEGKSNYLKSSKFTKKEFHSKEELNVTKCTEIKLENLTNKSKCLTMPIHENRTNFVKRDMLVPWKIKTPNEQSDNDTIHHRYYHLFVKGELEMLVNQTSIQIISSYYDKGNWCIILQKN